MAATPSQPRRSSAKPTVAMRRARLNGLHAAAIAAVGSLVLYLPAYALIAGTRVFHAPLSDVALQAVVQGVLTAIVALLRPDVGRLCRCRIQRL
jgi:hypothetical protein